jgi:hypothetical protein
VKRIPRRTFSAEECALIDSRITASTHPKQCDFIFDPASHISLLTPRGAGKTKAKIFRLLRAMMRGDTTTGEGAHCMFLAKNREQARGIVWNDLKELIFRLGWDSLTRPDEVRSEIVLCNGSSLKLLGFDERDEIEKPRGITWHEIDVDETGSAKRDLLSRFIDEVIGPRLVGSIVLGGTPGYLLEGLFYDVTRPGAVDEDGKPIHRPYADRHLPEYDGFDGWSSHTWTPEDGIAAGIEAIRVLREKQLKLKKKNGWSDSNPKWLREGMGQWAQDDTTSVYVYRAIDDDGREFNQWTPAQTSHSTRWAKLPPDWDPKTWGYGISMDIGWKDAFALEAFAYSYADPSRRMWHIGEIYKTKQPTKAIATMLIGEGLSIEKPGGIIGELGWPDFLIADFSGQGDRFIEDMKVEYGLIIKAVDKHPKYKDPAIEIVNADMFEGRFKIIRGSNLATELVGLQWVIDANGRRLENPRQPNHATDALLYFRMAVAALLPAFATTQPNATPSASTQPQPSSAAPRSEPDDGWSSDVGGWTSGDDMDGATEGSW